VNEQEALLALLDPDVVLWADPVAVQAGVAEIRGARDHQPSSSQVRPESRA
jgi:hypothetical protein